MSTRNAVTHDFELKDSCSTRLAPFTDWTAMRKSEHFVQFYEEDNFLVQSVAGFVGAGLKQGESAIVIGTPAHRSALEEHLREEGLDLGSGLPGRIFCLDAAETLSKFMVGKSPDAGLFERSVGALVAK